MQRARAPAISIKTKGFIRGRKMLLNPGMIPQILQQNRKSSCQPDLHHYFEIPKLHPLLSTWLLTHLAVTAYEYCKGPTNSAQRLLPAKIKQCFFSGNSSMIQLYQLSATQVLHGFNIGISQRHYVMQSLHY